MRIALVVAMARNGVIGRGGALPWRISDDLKWFRKVTLGKPLVMGRKTFDSIGKPLAGRDNIVVTRAPDWNAEGALRAPTIEDAVEIAGTCGESRGADEICIIGGAEIYAQSLDRAERIYLTQVEADVPGDAWFPPLDPAEWTRTPAGRCEAGEKNDFACEFVILDRR